jgi:hypothetical protein
VIINNLSNIVDYGKILIRMADETLSLTEAIKAQAKALGFQLVGITTPDPPAHFAVYESWLEAGRHGEMAYLASDRARQRRADPRQILPECRSIVVLGIRYPAPPTSLKPLLPQKMARGFRPSMGVWLLTPGGTTTMMFWQSACANWWLLSNLRQAARSPTAGTRIPDPSWSETWRSGPVWGGSARIPA